MMLTNAWLDTLPRATVHLTGAESPAFRALGVVGFHFALITAVGGALLHGLPVASAIVMALAAAASFFGWALVRRAITRSENLVLLEHAWIISGVVAGAHWLLGIPLFATLDVLSVALAAFFSIGRWGCAITGCCHGRPASFGIRYPEDHPVAQVAGIRLFPVQLVEAAGLAAIAAAGLVALPFSAPGAVLVWVLSAYSILRFGTESLRGDPRPHLFGVPLPRVAAGAQLTVAIVVDHLWSTEAHSRLATATAVAGLIVAGVIGQAWYSRRSRPLTLDAVARIRASAVHASDGRPLIRSGSEPGTISLDNGISVVTTASPSRVHISLAGTAADIMARRRLVAAALDGAGTILVSRTGVVHAFVPSSGRHSTLPRVTVRTHFDKTSLAPFLGR